MRTFLAALSFFLLAACSSIVTGSSGGSSDSGVGANGGQGTTGPEVGAGQEAGVHEGGASFDAATDAVGEAAPDAGPPCSTRITYGATWIHGPNHPAQDDVADGSITWDGTCTDDGASSYAVLSNGWKPYFQGHGACIVALDYAPSCGVPATCTTRVTYGPSWLHPSGHPAQFDDVPGRVFTDGACHAASSQSYADLSNGWQPYFSGTDGCSMSFSHTQCGGLYANPVIPVDCPDPGVLRDGDQYVLTCTSGGAADAYPIYTSPDLVTWTPQGHVFPAGHWPSWATGDFWAPEIHKVGTQYVVYFSARSSSGTFSVGAAWATSPLGPFHDIGQPLVHDPSMGLIDASQFTAPDGTPYVLWKEDGNAVGKPTPIHAQALASDGLSLVGSPSTLITNDQPWEGPLVEGPFMVAHGGSFYLFYSGNGYASTAYAIGVARASSPLGPFTKASGPIVVTGGAWAGPGHCSVVDTPAGDTYVVYHAWKAGAVGAAPGRLVLTDAIAWEGGWPAVPLGPSSTSRPLP